MRCISAVGGNPTPECNVTPMCSTRPAQSQSPSARCAATTPPHVAASHPRPVTTASSVQPRHTVRHDQEQSKLLTELYLFTSASKRSIRRFVITEKAPTRDFSWLKAATTAFTFKTLLRHYAKRALTPRSLNVKLGPRRKQRS